MARLLTDSERQEVEWATVTLDGKPARVCGFALPFPVVRNACHGVEFAPDTIMHVIRERGGRFES